MTTYVLNTAIITAAGTYRYAPITVEETKRLLQEGFVSAVGHEATARYLSALIGMTVPVRRVQVVMQPDDKAVVLRALERLPEGAVLTAEEMSKFKWELGLLECLE